LDEKSIVKIVSEAIQSSKKAIILDYPNTYEQAIELCRLISGVQPHDLLEKDRLNKKI
jgi:adenylate kinase family enzyme